MSPPPTPPRFPSCSAEAKAQLLADAARCLRPGGAMLLIDTMLGEGESREGWLGRALQRIESCLNDGACAASPGPSLWNELSRWHKAADLLPRSCNDAAAPAACCAG